MLFVLGNPFFSAHSEDARQVRAPEEVRDYYAAHCKTEYLNTLADSAKLLYDTLTLKFIGFKTAFDEFHESSSDDEAEGEVMTALEAEDQLARKAHELVVNMLHFRMASMSWHSCSWPGLLAIFASSDEMEQQTGVDIFRDDLEAFREAERLAPGSEAIQKMVLKSPFQLTIMKEVAALVESGMPDKEILPTLNRFSLQIFSGWGQTKVVEDSLRGLRQAEEGEPPTRG